MIWSNAVLASAKVFHGDWTVLLPLVNKDRQPVLERTRTAKPNNNNFFILPTLDSKKSKKLA